MSPPPKKKEVESSFLLFPTFFPSFFFFSLGKVMASHQHFVFLGAFPSITKNFSSPVEPLTLMEITQVPQLIIAS